MTAPERVEISFRLCVQHELLKKIYSHLWQAEPESAEAPKPRKPAGAVSMFGGVDPFAAMKKKSVSIEEKDEGEARRERFVNWLKISISHLIRAYLLLFFKYRLKSRIFSIDLCGWGGFFVSLCFLICLGLFIKVLNTSSFVFFFFFLIWISNRDLNSYDGPWGDVIF